MVQVITTSIPHAVNWTTMETNTSDVNQSMKYSRITVYVIGVILSFIALYVAIALIIYRVRAYKYRKELLRQTKSQRNKRPKGDCNSTHRHLNILVIIIFSIISAASSPLLDNLCISAAILAFLNCCSDYPAAYTRYTSNTSCKIIQSFSFLFYAAGVACLYSFLWLRQRACYKTPTLAKMHSRFSRVLSSIILPMFLIMMVAGMFLTAALWSFETTVYGCVETSSTRAPLVVLFSGSAMLQVTLLALFVYPLKRHVVFKNIAKTSNESLTRLVERSIRTTVLCIMSDAVAFILAMTLFYSVSFIIINYIYDANLVCNVICIVGSFADWKTRIGLRCCQRKKINDQGSPKRYIVSSTKTSTTML